MLCACEPVECFVCLNNGWKSNEDKAKERLLCGWRAQQVALCVHWWLLRRKSYDGQVNSTYSAAEFNSHKQPSSFLPQMSTTEIISANKTNQAHQDIHESQAEQVAAAAAAASQAEAATSCSILSSDPNIFIFQSWSLFGAVATQPRE